MSIEISNVTSASGQVSDITSQARSTSQPTPDRTSESSAQTSRADQVSLTPAAQQLRGLEQQIADQPVVDAQKVNEVKEAVASGSYEIDPQRIAGKMMDLEKALGDLS